MEITVCGVTVDAEVLRAVHDANGPRVAYEWLTGDHELTTLKVEDFAIEYYTKYNQHVRPNTY